MSRLLDATKIFDTLEVKWGDNLYTLRTITKSVSAEVDAAQKAANELDEDSTTDETVAALIDVIDVLLAPKDDTRPAKDVLSEFWENEGIGVDEITGFMQSLTEEARLRRRPTSAAKNTP